MIDDIPPPLPPRRVSIESSHSRKPSGPPPPPPAETVAEPEDIVEVDSDVEEEVEKESPPSEIVKTVPGEPCTVLLGQKLEYLISPGRRPGTGRT